MNVVDSGFFFCFANEKTRALSGDAALSTEEIAVIGSATVVFEQSVLKGQLYFIAVLGFD